MQTQRLGIWAGLVSSKKTIFKPCTLVLGRNIVLPVEFLAAVLCSFSPGGPLKVKYSIEKSTFMDFELYREKQWVKLVDSNVNRSKAFRNNLVARLITCSAFSNILSFARELPICQKKGKDEDPFLAGNFKKGKRNIFWGKDTLLDILSEVTSKREGWGIFLSSVYNRRPQSGIWTNIQTFCFWLFIGFKVLLTKQGGKIMNLIADKMLLWGVYWFLTVSLHEFQMKNAKNLMR